MAGTPLGQQKYVRDRDSSSCRVLIATGQEASFRFSVTEVCCVYSLESPHRGDSEFTLGTSFTLKRKST